MHRSAPSSARPRLDSIPAMPHMMTLGSQIRSTPRHLGPVCASETPPDRLNPLPEHWTGRDRRALVLVMGIRVAARGLRALNRRHPDVSDAKRGYADGTRLDGRGSAGLRRRQRNERDGIL